MKRERAIEILRWGPYARPVATDAERKEAIGMLAQDTELREALCWPVPEKKGRNT